MDELIRTVHVSARRQYERSVKWSVVLAAGVVGMYITFVEKHARLSHEVSEAAERKDYLADALGTVTGYVDTIKSLPAAANGLADKTLDDIRQDFFWLEMAVGDAVGGDSADRGPTPGRLPPGAGTRSRFAEIQGGPRPEPEPREFNIDPARARALRAATNRREFIEAVEPVVREQIIEPRLKELNDAWGRRARSAVVALRSLPGRDVPDPEDGEGEDAGAETFGALPALESKIERTAAFLDEFRFAMAADSLWWKSQSGKVAAFSKMKFSFSENVRMRSDLTGVQKVLDEITTAVDQAEASVARLQAEMADLDEAFKRSRDALAALGVSLKRFGVDLRQFVFAFPVIASVLLGAAIAWPARARLRLAEMDAMMAARHPDLPRNAVLFRGLAVAEERWLLATAAWAAGAALMVVVPAYRLGAMGVLDEAVWTFELALGLVILMSLVVYRVRLTWRALGLARRSGRPEEDPVGAG